MFKVRGYYSGIKAREEIKMSSMDSSILKKLEEMETKIRQLEEEKRAPEIPLRMYERKRKWEAEQTDFPEEEGESLPMQEDEEEYDEEEYELEPTSKKSKKDWEILKNVRQFKNMKIPDIDDTMVGTSFRAWVRAMVIINPGNPTGQCLSKASLRELLEYCYLEKLVLLADEVYQQNIYQDQRPFVSARKVLMEMGLPFNKEVQLVSYHTVSKGYWGECGQRGGYFEMINIPSRTVEEIYKVASISLSPNVAGQIFLGLMVNPPKPGDISHAQFVAESKAILESLRRRAHIMTDGFNSCRNVVCNFTEGAMYSFPQIKLPPKAIAAAKEVGKAPDVFYCLKLLEATGMSTVPGSGFGQKEGDFHLRTTILPPEEEMPEIMANFKKFNDNFMAEYEDYTNFKSKM